MMVLWGKWCASGFLAVLLALAGSETALASFTIVSQEEVSLKVTGYSGLSEATLFKGALKEGKEQKIDIFYQGLALLVFDGGPQYPVILGEPSFLVTITDPGHPPSFAGSDENDCFYKLLTGEKTATGRFDFPLLMVEARQLLEASFSIRTVADLMAMKERFHVFVRGHYRDLRHSDMLMRLIGQYFMMHEYVDFHVNGAPASDILVRYRKEVIDGVENWIRILNPYIPEYEIVNYCISLYYNRSMVTLAHRIAARFSDYAYCPGNILKNIQIPEDVSVFDAEGNKKGVVKNFSDNAVLAFVSDDCPVSMVETVIRAREQAGQGKGTKLIVLPLQKLSEKHLAMRRMVADSNMLFIKDEQWMRKAPKNIRLPLFTDIAIPMLTSNPNCPK